MPNVKSPAWSPAPTPPPLKKKDGNLLLTQILSSPLYPASHRPRSPPPPLAFHGSLASASTIATYASPPCYLTSLEVQFMPARHMLPIQVRSGSSRSASSSRRSPCVASAGQAECFRQQA
ncbi:hypothetical protein PVAP13_4KG182215 [Panicum virgatum]|uniref:Uncharacterized protein n=1 Tax=Panicum virgatum TaxID=38727 RepID=A0A8T0TNB7_PANVG|nr:hypothetical protein PVAP13_4KG182215 [Panicum virgatum]